MLLFLLLFPRIKEGKGPQTCRGVNEEDGSEGVAVEGGELEGPEGLEPGEAAGDDGEKVGALEVVAVVEVVLVAEEGLGHLHRHIHVEPGPGRGVEEEAADEIDLGGRGEGQLEVGRDSLRHHEGKRDPLLGEGRGGLLDRLLLDGGQALQGLLQQVQGGLEFRQLVMGDPDLLEQLLHLRVKGVYKNKKKKKKKKKEGEYKKNKCGGGGGGGNLPGAERCWT